MLAGRRIQQPPSQFGALPSSPLRLTVTNHVGPFISQERETEAQGQAGTCSRSPNMCMAQPGLTLRAWETQPRSPCDSGQPTHLLSLCYRTERLRDVVMAPGQTCQILMLPASRETKRARIPSPQAMLAAGHSRTLALRQGRTQSGRLLSCILPPPLGLHLIARFATRLISACADSEEPVERERCQQLGVLRAACRPPLPQAPRWANRARAETVAQASSGAGFTVPPETGPEKDSSLRCSLSLP